MHRLRVFLLSAIALLIATPVLAQSEIASSEAEVNADEEAIFEEIAPPDAELDEAISETESGASSADELDERLRRRSLEQQAEDKARAEGREDATLQDVFAVEQAAESQADIEQADIDVMDMDVAGSIDDAVNIEGYFKWGGDLRTAYNWADQNFRDGDSDRDDNLTARLRFRTQVTPAENFSSKEG